MAGKTKGAKSKPKAAATKDKAAAPEKGCHACNFSGEVCRECKEPATGCECQTFQPVSCSACTHAEPGGEPACQPPASEPAAEPVSDFAADADGQTEIIRQEVSEALSVPAEVLGNVASGDVLGPSVSAVSEATENYAAKVSEGWTEAAAAVPVQAAVPSIPAGRDAELESLVEQSVKRRMERLKQGNRRRHHTMQLSLRVLTGILKAGEAAAAGGADGFFGRWCRNDLMAWEALMDAAEWAQEELNAREFRRLKRESLKAQQNTAGAAS